jgi:prepilin peptidase CpaA
MNAISVLVLLVILAAAVVCDIRMRKIPNRLIVAGLLLGFGGAMLPGGLGAMEALSGFGIGFGVFLPLYMLRVLCAGDVKLMAVVGAFLGTGATLGAMLFGLAAGGVIAVGYGLYLGRLGAILGNIRDLLYHSILSLAGGHLPQAGLPPGQGTRLPYSLAIASGVAIFVALRYQHIGSIG